MNHNFNGNIMKQQNNLGHQEARIENQLNGRSEQTSECLTKMMFVLVSKL